MFPTFCWRRTPFLSASERGWRGWTNTKAGFRAYSRTALVSITDLTSPQSRDRAFTKRKRSRCARRVARRAGFFLLGEVDPDQASLVLYMDDNLEGIAWLFGSLLSETAVWDIVTLWVVSREVSPSVTFLRYREVSLYFMTPQHRDTEFKVCLISYEKCHLKCCSTPVACHAVPRHLMIPHDTFYARRKTEKSPTCHEIPKCFMGWHEV